MQTVNMNRQAFPEGGGAVLAAGRTYQLDDDVVNRLPKGSYRVVGVDKGATPPKTKPARAPETK